MPDCPLPFAVPQLCFPVSCGVVARLTARQSPECFVFVWGCRDTSRRGVLRFRHANHRWRFHGGRLYAWRYLP